MEIHGRSGTAENTSGKRSLAFYLASPSFAPTSSRITTFVGRLSVCGLPYL